MWKYEKRLQYPVNISCRNPGLAKLIVTQFGGADGELGAANRYLSQRFTMPYSEVKALLTDIGTEELAHSEIVATIVYQLTHGASIHEIKEDYAANFVEHTLGIYPQDASGNPFHALAFQSKGDPITDLTEDMAAEQKARTTYENLIALTDDEEVLAPLRFLRQREIIHYQRFAEALELVKCRLNEENFYEYNPSLTK
ncbi:MAG: manganese catalase family protein [Erysipelotrichaceae bacterium]|nr:manganese catalase family protein [Erysipelotrichaceae bacterium]